MIQICILKYILEALAEEISKEFSDVYFIDDDEEEEDDFDDEDEWSD